MQKLLKKIKLHFTDPGKALFFDLRICFNFYSKLMLVYYYKINIPKSDFFITPDYIDLYNLFKKYIKKKTKLCARNWSWIQHYSRYTSFKNYETKTWNKCNFLFS